MTIASTGISNLKIGDFIEARSRIWLIEKIIETETEMADTHLALLQAGFEELENGDFQKWREQAETHEIMLDLWDEESPIFDDLDLI